MSVNGDNLNKLTPAIVEAAEWLDQNGFLGSTYERLETGQCSALLHLELSVPP